jgi:hypothetical protein
MKDDDDGRPDPARWRDVEPEHAEEILEAVRGVVSAIDSLRTTTGDDMVAANATRWAIEILEEWMADDIAADLAFGVLDDPDDDDA